MTALCPAGGPSRQKLGTPAVLLLSGSDLVSLVASAFNIPEWIAVAAYALAQQYVLSSMCATDPPPMPTFTAQDVLDMLPPNVNPASPGAQKFSQLLTIAAWHTFCECENASTPTVGSPPTYPPGAPIISPPALQPTFQAPCWTGQGFGLANQTTNPDKYMPNNSTFDCSLRNGPYLLRSCLDATGVRINGTCTVDPVGPNGSYDVTLTWYNSTTLITGNVITFEQFRVAPGQSGTTGFVIPPTGWVIAQARVTEVLPLGVNGVNVTSEVWCPGQTPGTPNSACCPPDPVLQAELSRIQSYLQFIYNKLGTALHPWVDGTTHTNLTGEGTFQFVDQAIGVRVTVNNLPPNWPAGAQLPPYLFSAGFVVPYAESYPMRGQRLIYSPQAFELPAQATGIGWTLPPPLSINITELIPGP